MMTIDFHVHAFPDALAPRAMASLRAAAGGMPSYADGTVGALKRALEAAGADKGVLLQIATKPGQARKINEAALDLRCPELEVFGALHPLCEHALDDVAWLKRHGFKGVKLHPEYQGFFADDERARRVYRALGEAGLITVFHAGYDVAYDAPARCAPERLARVLPDFQGAPVVAAHMGGCWAFAEVERFLLSDERVCFDTSFSLGHIPVPVMRRMILKHGASRVLLGSDSPWSPIEGEIGLVRTMNLGEDDERAVLGGNAARLLGLEG